jgi:nucleoside-diphosphate-sugar epimerase
MISFSSEYIVTNRRIPIDDLEHILNATASIWEEVRGRRVFLTGGTGFFGCWLVESFCHVNRVLGLNAQATLLTRDPVQFAEKCPHLAADPAITLLAGDVRNFAFPQGEFHYVIHAATDSSLKRPREEPLEMLTTILGGTERTLEFASRCGARKFLLTSSGAVYGRQPAEMTHLPESFLGAPDSLDAANVYAEGKRASELMCAVYQKAQSITPETGKAEGEILECKIARCWAFCGPHLPLDAHFAIGNFIGDVLSGRPIVISGDGTPRRSYLYGADLAIWLWTILFRAPTLVPINVGSERDISIRELAEIVATTLNPTTEIRVSKQAVAGTPASRYVPSLVRAREMLGLRELVGLEEAILRTAAWYRPVQKS